MARAAKLRIAAWVLGGILAVLVLLIALLHAPPIRRYALKQAIQILDRQGIRFAASDIDYNLLELKATVDDVTIASKQAPNLPPLLVADQAQIDLSLRTLLQGGYFIESAVLQDPKVHLVIQEDGTDNIPNLPEKQDQPQQPTPQILIDEALIKGGTIEVDDRQHNVHLTLPLEQVAVDGNPATLNHEVTLEKAQGGSITFEGRTLPINQLSASALIGQDAAEIRRLQLALADTTLAVSGTVKDFSDPRLDITAKSNLALGRLADFAGIKQTARGNVNVAVSATGPLQSLRAEAKIEGDDLALNEFRNVDLNAQATYLAGDSRVVLDSLNVSAPAGTLRGEASIALDAQAGSSTAELVARNLDLGQITSAFEAPVQIASRADAKIDARWPGLQFEQASGDATVDLTATRATPAENVLPVSGSLTVETAGDQVILSIPRMQTLDATASGRVIIANRRTLDGRLQVEASNVGATIDEAEAYLGNQITTTPVSGAAQINASLGGTIQAPTAAATLSAPDLDVGELQDVGVQADVRYTPQQLGIQEASVTWRGETVALAGTVGLKGRTQALDLTARSEQISVDTILAALDRSDIPASGTFTFTADIEGTTQQPQGQFEITGTDLSAYNETFGTLTAQAQIEGDQIQLTQLRLQKPQPGGDGTLVASGTFNVDTNRYEVQAATEDLRITNLQLPDGTAVSGTLELAAEGQGTLENPSGELRLRAGNVQVGTNEYGDIVLTADVENQTADIDLAAPKFNVTADATIGLQQPYPATFEVQANETNLAALPIQLEQQLKGTVTATVKGSGNLQNIEAAQAVATVANADIVWNGQPIRTEGPLVARYDNQRLTIDEATIVAADSRVSVEGTLPLEPAAGEGKIEVAAKLDLGSLRQYIPAEQDFTLRGTAAIEGTISGSLKRIDPNLSVVVDDGYFSTPDLAYGVSRINVDAQIQNGALQIESARANYGPATLTGSGTVPFGLLPGDLPVELPRQQGPAQLTAELQDLDLGSIEGTPEDFDGRLSARLEVTAPRPELEAITGKLTFPQLRVSFEEFTLEEKGTAEILLANGTARLNNFLLTGPETAIRVDGTAGLTGQRPLNLEIDGKLNASVLAALVEDTQAEGATTFNLAVTGPMADPQLKGFVEVADAQISIDDPRIGVEDLSLRVELAGTRATITRLDGVLNGGDLSGGGTIAYEDGQFRNTNLTLKAQDVFLEIPEDLTTVSNIDLRLTDKGKELIVGGNVTIQEGGYTEDIRIGSRLLERLGEGGSLDFTQERNPLLENVRFNVRVRTENPILIDNNFAEAAITADVRVLGTPYLPGLSGTVTIEEGSILRFQERRYAVERGVITFTNERRIEPNFDILATTSLQGYDVRMQISGEVGDTETTLTSDPPLPEPDILALLLTGKTMDEMRGQEFEVARNQVLSYLTGSVGSRIGSQIAGATGLSTVRIEPNLIAAEADPGARLTVGQDITRNLDLIYSMDLVDSSDQIYQATYDITKRFTTRGTRQSDGSWRFDFAHDLRFGGVPAPRRGDKHEQRRVGNISILGDEYFTEMKIRDKFDIKPGSRYDFFKIRRGLDRLQKMYAKENLLETRIRLNREEEPGEIDLTLRIQPGPIVDFVFEGISVPGSVRKQVQEIWHAGVFDTQRAAEAVEAIRAWLVREDHLQPVIEYKIATPAENRKRVVFDIQPGPEFQNVRIVFDGAKRIEPDTLREIVDDQDLKTQVYTDPEEVTDLLARYYREQGFLEAEVNSPKYDLNALTRTGAVVFPVTEGPLYEIAEVNFEGNDAFTDERLAEAVPIPKGEPYKPVLRENALQRLRELYWDHGYNDVETEFVLQKLGDATTGDTSKVELTFKIAEGRQAIVREIEVVGNRNTSENLVRTQLGFKPGDVLSLDKLSRARRELYETGAYSLIEINREEIGAENDGQTRARQVGEANEKPVVVRVRVREIQPWQLRYGGFFDTERGPGGIADFSNRNMLGGARVIGLRGRYDSQLREGRLYFSQPALRRWPLRTIITPYVRYERNPETETVDPFNVDRVGLSLQQEMEFRRNFLFNFAYTIERSRTYDPVPDPLFDVRLRIASLTSTLSRDLRDEILDATRGSFLSHAVQYSPELLGSQVRFIKYFGQYFKYIPLQEPRLELFTNELIRPRLVYAGGLRVGLAKGFGGQEVPLAERFFAGGSTTIRGFEQNSVGPMLGEDPLGGEAVLILNNEIRFPLVSIFDGAAFVDIGNVYNRVSDISLTDLRKSAGLGLRIRTPWFLIRADYGVKLDRKPGESLGRLFFSIGQAF